MDLREQLQRHLGAAYTIERELGGGGMSRVFVANEVRLGRRIVVKVLSPDLAQGLNAERFEREILVAASLQHPNIVPLLVAGEVDGIPWFTMPFVEGESLRHRLAHGAVPINEVVSILRDVTRALAYAHAHGVVHRDIKPDNVLLAGGAATVTDFGIAKAITASRSDAPGATLTQLGTSIGTPAYMAPEQVAGDPALDHRVDLYALGCTAFELLTGQPPYFNRTPQQMLAAHLSEAVPSAVALRSDTPPALAGLVARLMAKDPSERPQSAADVLQRLDTVTSTSAPMLAFSAPGMLRKALVAWAVGTVVVLLCTRAATIAIGLPDWVFPGAVIIMALGLPALLLTAYVQHVTRRVATATPTLTPGGTMAPKAPSGTVATMAIKASPHVTWRRTWRGGALALGAFVVLIAVFMITRAAGIGPWASLVAAGKLGTNDRIVLADLVASPSDSALAPIVVEAVRAGLAQSNAIRLVDQSDIADVLQQMKRSRDTPLDSSTVVHEVALRTNAAGILGGRLTQVGSSYVLSLSLTATNDGAMLASYQSSANGVKDLLGVVDDITRKLRSRVGESLKRVQRSIPLQRATTTSLDALRLYSEASVANDVDRKYGRAVQLLRQAVALDTTFALGWRKLAVALNNTDASQLAVDSAVEKATRYADRLPEVEKNLVWAEYYQVDIRGSDRGKALAAYQRVYAIDSTSQVAATDLADIYRSRLEFDSAARYGRRSMELEPSAPRPFSVVTDLTDLGRLDSAAALLDSLTRATRNGATDGRILQERARLFSARGQWDSMAEISATLHRLSVGHPGRPTGTSIGANVAELRGQFSRAAVLDSAALNPASVGRAEFEIWIRQRMPEGLQALDQLVAGKEFSAMAPSEHFYPFIALLYADAGAPAKARAILDASLLKDPGAKAPDFQATLAGARASIALAEGKYDEAIRQIHASAVGPDGAPATGAAFVDYALARAFDRSGRADSALIYFQRYLAVLPVLRFDAADLAVVEKRLGELFDARHQRDSALAHYTAFVDHWKNADPDLQPTVASVKKRMAELVGAEEH